MITDTKHNSVKHS